MILTFFSLFWRFRFRNFVATVFFCLHSIYPWQPFPVNNIFDKMTKSSVVWMMKFQLQKHAISFIPTREKLRFFWSCFGDNHRKLLREYWKMGQWMIFFFCSHKYLYKYIFFLGKELTKFHIWQPQMSKIYSSVW